MDCRAEIFPFMTYFLQIRGEKSQKERGKMLSLKNSLKIMSYFENLKYLREEAIFNRVCMLIDNDDIDYDKLV